MIIAGNSKYRENTNTYIFINYVVNILIAIV